jgi:hypothetical protein
VVKIKLIYWVYETLATESVIISTSYPLWFLAIGPDNKNLISCRKLPNAKFQTDKTASIDYNSFDDNQNIQDLRGEDARSGRDNRGSNTLSLES